MTTLTLRRVGLIATVLIAAGITPVMAGPPLTSAAIRTVFASIARSSSLSHPSVLLIDRASGSILYERDSTTPRRPASVMKLLSATSTLEYLDPNYRYTTTVSLGQSPNTIVLSGGFDPWMTADYKSALKDHRVWVNFLGNKALTELKAQRRGKITSLQIKYYGVYPNDIADLRSYLRSQGVVTTATVIAMKQLAGASRAEITSAKSPTIGDMLKFALLWSDNLLAERLARAAAHAAGFSMDDVGVSKVFHAVLMKFQVDSTGLFAKDGSGLAKGDRVTAKIIGELLLRTRENVKFAPLFEDLPVAGVSGTLENRFLKTAPQAVGLVHAKTGTLSGTVSLAGYIESGQHEYIFVVIADQIPKGYLATNLARDALDTIIGKLASPLTLPIQTPIPNETQTPSQG